MSRSLADIDPDQLSKAARFVFDNILWRQVVEEVPLAELAADLKLTTSEIRDAIEFLGAEIEATLGGATLPELEAAAYEALRDDIAARGQLVPIILDAAGAIVEGSNRMRICRELGLEPVTHKTALVGEDARTAAIALNANRRQLTSAQKRRIIRVELIHNPDRADREIARLAGVDHKTVASARRELDHLRKRLVSEGGEIPHRLNKPKTVRVDEGLYDALHDVAQAALSYYGEHEHEHPSTELSAALELWQLATGDSHLAEDAA